jgi:hypothetical protein
MNSVMTGPDSFSKRQRRLRSAGLLLLLLGLGGAGVVYWTGTAPEDTAADPATARAYRTERRDIEINFGRVGVITNDLEADFERPGTQAAVIAVVSILLASGCFGLARWLEGRGEPDDTAG